VSDTITPTQAAAMLATDNRGQPAISPTARKLIEAARIDRLRWLEAENATLRDDIAELKRTWHERLESAVALRMRGMRRE
jgi:hypothetical protein